MASQASVGEGQGPSSCHPWPTLTRSRKAGRRQRWPLRLGFCTGPQPPRLAPGGSWQVLLCVQALMEAPYCGLQGHGPEEPLWEFEKSLSVVGICERHPLPRCGLVLGHGRSCDFIPASGAAMCPGTVLTGAASWCSEHDQTPSPNSLCALCPLSLCPNPFILHTAVP